MKHLRLWLLVVLVALLPVRGAVAAAMLCAPAGAAGQAEWRVGEHDPAAHHGHHEADGQAHAGHHGDSVGDHDGDHDGGEARHDAGHDNKCTMCSAFCSATPLPSTVPGLPEPLSAGAAHFPDLDAPAPTFQSGGPERPPRSI